MKKLLLTVAIVATSFTGFAQVGVGTVTPNAALDVSSTTAGVLIPRMNSATRSGLTVATDQNGMMVYDTDTKSFWFYEHTTTAWKEIGDTTIDPEGNNIISRTSSGSRWNRSYLAFQRASGNSADRTYVLENMPMGGIHFNYYDPTTEDYRAGARISGYSTDAHSDTSAGTALIFYTTDAKALASMSQRMRIEDDGNIKIGAYENGVTGAESILDISSTNSGVILPRIIDLFSITNPVNGMMVYHIASGCVRYYENDAWSPCLSGASNSGAPANSDTILAMIGTEADATTSSVTIAQLNQIYPTLTNIISESGTSYQNYLNDNPTLFSSPALISEVQAMLDVFETDYAALAVLYDQSYYPAEGNITSEVFTTAGLTGFVVENALAYEAEFAVISPKPSTIPAMQMLIDNLNTFISTQDIVVTLTGKIWADRNLGSPIIGTSTYELAARGHKYQWGRKEAFTNDYDTANNFAGPVSAADYATGIYAGKFITSGGDWLNAEDSDNDRWNAGTATNPIKTIYDPCPDNFRVPSMNEIALETKHFSGNNTHGAFNSVLKLVSGGRRSGGSGEFTSTWSTAFAANSNNQERSDINSVLRLSGSNYGFYETKATGQTIRCIKE